MPLRIATASLAGCFGCHMSLLDIDERLFELLPLWNLTARRSPTSKPAAPAMLAWWKAACATPKNVEVLRAFRKQCRILVAVGACAINGGLPAQRNHLSLAAVLHETYQASPGLAGGGIPNDAELPLPLDQVHPLHEVVRIDYFLPGCPPSAEVFWTFLSDLLAGREPHLPTHLIHYD